MKKSVLIVLLVLAFSVFVLFHDSVLADVSLGNQSHSIETKYAPGEELKGWINISIEDEESDALFETNSGSSARLIDVLKINNANYTCSTSDCESDYSVQGGGEEAKNIFLNKGEKKIFGFKLTGNINKINSIGFEIESDALDSYVNQLEVDLLNDGVLDFMNNKTGSNIHDADYGCFDISESASTATLGNQRYCERVTVPQSPSFFAGAWVKNDTNPEDAKDARVTMEIYDGENFFDECDLTSEIPNKGEEGKDVSCEVNKIVKKAGDYYACISSNDVGNYKIRYSSENQCGFLGTPPEDEIASYRIFARGKSFGAFGTLTIADETQFEGDFLYEIFQNYLESKYGFGMQCPEEGCVIPVSLKSNIDGQSIILKNLEIDYDTQIAGGISETNFYNVSTTPAIVNANVQKLNLNGTGIKAPTKFGKQDLILELKNNRIFKEEIEVEKIPQITSLNPLTAVAAFPTTFTARTETFGSGNNVTGYEWKFGDGKSEKTTSNQVQHSYSNIGYYNLEVSVINSAGLGSSKTFNISVQSPKDAINSILKDRVDNFESFKTEVEKLPSFEQNAIKNAVGFDDIESKISGIEQRNATASIDSDYIGIMADLVSLRIPSDIETTKDASSVSFYPEGSDVDLDSLSKIGGGNFRAEDRSKYEDAVIAWGLNNAEIEMDMKEFSAVYAGEDERIVNLFKIAINEKISREDSYFVVKKLADMEFKDSSSVREEEGYYFIEVSDGKETIEFSTTENYDFTNLPAFISPPLTRLSIVSSPDTNEEGISKWIWFVLILFLIAILGLIAYIIMQEWYKRRYENYLFKNRNDLYNLVSYIENMKKRGIDNNEVSSRLKKTGWSSEQVRYVMRKYHGKRTGMLEIPVERVLNLFRKKKDKVDTTNLRGKYHY